MYSEYYGEYSDYTRKGGVICSDILLPSHAPPEYADRQTLWNAVEKAERGKNAQLAFSSFRGYLRGRKAAQCCVCRQRPKRYAEMCIRDSPKGGTLDQCGRFLQREKYRVRVFNSIDFSKSMHYNPLAYIKTESDVLKFVTALIANTKGDGKEGDEFWTCLLYTSRCV